MLIHHLIWIRTGLLHSPRNKNETDVDATEKNKGHYRCSKNSKHLHILPGMKTTFGHTLVEKEKYILSKN